MSLRILFTGGSSFTGQWLVRELVDAGHEVTAVFRRPRGGYQEGLRGRRVELVARCCRPVFGVSFGDDAFVDLIRGGDYDLLAHHAAEVANYRSPDFDVVAAVASNGRNLPRVLSAFAERGGRRVLLTGSFFEGGEGAGSEGLPDFSPYALSKAITARLFLFHCARAGLHLGKFVIPNPFGPLEEPRFSAYLMNTWLDGKVPSCATPAYVRDNIHVSLLARAYARFAAGLPGAAGFSRLNPSGYPESQGAFALRMAAEMRPRLGLPCEVELKHQAEFPEPRVRINTDVLEAGALGWNEAAAWDEMARWYRDLRAR